MTFTTKSYCLVIGLVLMTALAVSAQQGCEKLDKNKPSAYIAFEKETTETINGKSRDLALLRLTNNTSCEIAVETDGQGIDGLSGTVQERKNNSRQVVFYDVRSSEKSAWEPANYFANRDLSFHYTVFPGFSVIFPVKPRYARTPFRLSVKFTFAWEVRSFENSDHRTFYLFELPKGYEERSK